MNNVRDENQYKIPWINIILVIVIALGALLTIVAPVVVMLIGIRYDYTAVITPSFILMMLFGAIFFIKLRFWTNLSYYPIKRWIYKNLKCIECGQAFTNCERTMEHPKPLASFICYCGNCKRVELIETGAFDRLLTLKPDPMVQYLYETKYRREAYKIPIGVWIKFLSANTAFVLLFVFLLLVIPALICVSWFGPSKEAAEEFKSVSIFIFLGLLLLCNMFYWKSKRLRNFTTYPIRRWILNNVKCPKCGDPITKCNVELPGRFSDFTKYDTVYSVYCIRCRSKETMEISGFESLIRFT
jgi:hypothetical protein